MVHGVTWCAFCSSRFTLTCAVSWNAAFSFKYDDLSDCNSVKGEIGKKRAVSEAH